MSTSVVSPSPRNAAGFVGRLDDNTPRDSYNAHASPGTLLDIAAAIEGAAQSHDERTVAHALLQQAYDADQKGRRIALQLPGLSETSGPVCLDGDTMLKSMAGNALTPKPTPVRINHTLDALGEYTGIADAATMTGRTMAFLEAVSRTPAMQMIIRTRQNQARRFCRRPKYRGDIGFEIRQVSERKTLSPAAARERDRIEDFILYGGDRFDASGNLRRRRYDNKPGVWDGNEKILAGGLANMVGIMVRNAMALDWAPVRMEPGFDENAVPIAWFSNADVDAKQIRRTYEERYTPQIDTSGLPVAFVELDPGVVTAGSSLIRREFPWNKMAVMVTNPRTDFYGLGYGFSIVESALDILASIFLNLKFRAEYFDNNHIPPAIVALRGQLSGFSDNSLNALRTQLAMKVGGPGAFFRLLYLGLPADEKAGIDIHPLRSATGAVNEMEYAHQDFQALMTLLAALAQIDPAEFGMKGAGEGNVLQEADPETRLEHSQDKGLIPLLEAIATFINQCIVQFLNPDFEFAWVGLYPESFMSETRAQARLALGDTVNDIRDAQDRSRDLYPKAKVLWTKTSRKFSPDKFPTPEAWREKVDAAYETEFEKVYGEDVEPWSIARDVASGNIEMMQVEMQEQQELQGAKAGQKQINDLVAQGHSPEEAKQLVQQQQMQVQMGAGSPQDDGQVPGQNLDQNGANPLQQANVGGQSAGQDVDQNDDDDDDEGTFTGRFHDDGPHDFERFGAPKAKLQKAVTNANPRERVIRIVRY